MDTATRNWIIFVCGYNLLFFGYLLYLVFANDFPKPYSYRLLGVSLGFSVYSVIFCIISNSDRHKLSIRKLYSVVPFFGGISTVWIAYGLLDYFQLQELFDRKILAALLFVMLIQGYLLTLWGCYAFLKIFVAILAHFHSSFLRAAVLVLYLAGTGYAAYLLHNHLEKIEDYTLYYNIWYLGTVVLEVFVKASIGFYLSEQRLAKPETKLKKHEFLTFSLFVLLTSLLLLSSVVASKIFSGNLSFVIGYAQVFNQSWLEAVIHLGIEGLILLMLVIEGCCYYRGDGHLPSQGSSVSSSVHLNANSENLLIMPLIQPVNPAVLQIIGNNEPNNAVNVERYREIHAQEQDQGRTDRSQSIYFAKECCICGEEYSDKATALRCGHIVHKSCLEQWLQRKRECPVCRREIL